MKFINKTDLLQYFANEYIKPGDKVLVLGCYIPELKNIVEFVDSEVFFVKDTSDHGIDLTSNYKNLPFEDESFNIVMNFVDFDFKFDFLKKGGILFINQKIINGIDYYHCSESLFTVLRS